MDCKIVNIWNRIVLITFSFEQFDGFVNSTRGLQFDDYIEHHPDGLEALILASSFPSISLTFLW
jgi:hypothetical protein